MGIRRFLPGVVTLVLVLAVVIGTGFIGGSQALGAVTTITVISPDVSVRHGATGAFVSAVDGEVLESGDAVRTGESGRAVLTYFEGSSVTIEPSTELAIDRADGSPDGTTIILMTQTLGRTWHVVTKLITGGSKYEVRTPASTASVRGTAFEVQVTDRETTVTTTEGTVVDAVPDPAQPGRVVEVPVVAGATHAQPRDAAPTQPRAAPQPKRTVTVTVDSTTSIVVDPLGRANGLTKNGTLVVQTPGAQVKREGGKIVITLPDIPDGTVSTRVEDRDDERVRVRTRIVDDRRAVEVEDDADRDEKDRSATSGVEIRSRPSAAPEGRVLDDDEKSSLRSPKVVERTPSPTARPTPARTVRPTPARTVRPAQTQTPEPVRTSERRMPSPGKATETPEPDETNRP